MTGRGEGFCILRREDGQASGLQGFAGFRGKPINKIDQQQTSNSQDKEIIMPAGDGTGPLGMGPMSGRAAGFCAGYGMPGYMNPVPGRGFGMGFGHGRGFGMGFGRSGGRGWRNLFYATGLTGRQRATAGWPMWGGVPPAAAPTKEQELEALKSQAEYFENALGEIRKRLEEVETEK